MQRFRAQVPGAVSRSDGAPTPASFFATPAVVLLVTAVGAPCQETGPRYAETAPFCIQVLDSRNGRGIPAVELTTTNGILLSEQA